MRLEESILMAALTGFVTRELAQIVYHFVVESTDLIRMAVGRDGAQRLVTLPHSYPTISSKDENKESILFRLVDGRRLRPILVVCTLSSRGLVYQSRILLVQGL